MAHYYFDLKNGMTLRDHAGMELSSDADAISRAYLIADRIGLQPPEAHDQPRHVCIIREDGHEVTRVPVNDLRQRRA